MASDLSILYADQHLVAVVKPARVPTASDSSGDDSLLARVRRWNEARQSEGKKGYCVPIHFLDRPVSGLVLFGLSSKGSSRLNELFRARKLQKTYLAIVHGHPAAPRGRLEHELVKDKSHNLTSVAKPGDPAAKRSVLSYQEVARRGKLSMLLVRPETGRSHQIRVQLASLGTPIWGDVKYGAPEAWNGSIALHALRLSFQHPVSKEALELEAPTAASWQELWPEPWPLSETDFLN